MSKFKEPQLSTKEIAAARAEVKAAVGGLNKPPKPEPQDPVNSAEAMREGAEAFLQSLDSIDMTLLVLISRFRRSSHIQLVVGSLMAVSLLTLVYVTFVLVDMAHGVNTLVKDQKQATTKLAETRTKVEETLSKLATTQKEVKETKERVEQVAEATPKVEIDEETGKASVVVPFSKSTSDQGPPPVPAPASAPAPAPPPRGVRVPLGIDAAEAL